MFSADLMLSGSVPWVLHRVNAVTEKARASAFVVTLGTASKFELDDQSCLCCLAGVNIEGKYGGCLDEKAW